MIEATQVIDLINRTAQVGQDFLFGIDYELKCGFFIPNPKESNQLMWRVKQHSNAKNFTPHYRPGSFFRPMPIDYRDYQKKFEIIQHHLSHGNSFLANLTIQTPISTDYSFEEIYMRSNSPYVLYFPSRFVCFSPETFITYSNGHIATNPMKGTISGSIPDAEQVILNDYKESAEHFTIVDFVRSELSRVATNVQVTNLRYIDRLQTSHGEVLQVSSQIEAQVNDYYQKHLGDMLLAILPAASICGAPKEATLNAIRQAEEQQRGYYTGVFGYFDGNSLDCAVMIRYLEQIDNHIFFRSGGGITINSDCQSEYHEVLQKIYLPF